MIELLALCFSCLAALVPTVFYAGAVWWFDRYEREPLWLLVVTFLWGAIPAIIVSLIFEIILDIPLSYLVSGEGADLVSAAFIAPPIEEIAKAIPLAAIFLLYRHEFDGMLDGLLYGALVGFGFAMTENVFYFLGAFSEGGWGDWGMVVFLRTIIFGLNHALFTAVVGAALGYARYELSRPRRLLAPFVGLGLAIILHTIHNFFVSLDSTACFISLVTDWMGVAAVLGAAIWAARQESRLIWQELQEEVAAGRITPTDAAAAGNYRLRLRERWVAHRGGGSPAVARLSARHDTAAELALKKRQFRLYGNERHNAAAIAALRDRLHALL